MEVVDRYGLALALVEPRELADEPWLRTERPIDVARLPDPPFALHGELSARGFLRKPSTLTWVSELGDSEEEFLARLASTSRKGVRRAQRRAASACLREVVEEPVSPGTLDRFLGLYEERVGRMAFGVPFALEYRDAVLHGPQKFFGVFAFAGDEMAGGCLMLEWPEQDAVVLRFSAVTAQWRRFSLARALYFSAMRLARDRGYARATLGNEPNLLGHLTQPGLFRFKVGLGFHAVPSQDFGDPQGGDEADLVLRLDTLSDPTLVLAYDEADPGPGRDPVHQLAGHLICNSAVEKGPYSAPFLTSLATRVLKPPAALA